MIIFNCRHYSSVSSESAFVQWMGAGGMLWRRVDSRYSLMVLFPVLIRLCHVPAGNDDGGTRRNIFLNFRQVFVFPIMTMPSPCSGED